jgi:Sec-independent protein translocase protein TatA
LQLPLFQILVIALIALLLFGRGRVGEWGQRVRRFRGGIDQGEEPVVPLTADISAEPAPNPADN